MVLPLPWEETVVGVDDGALAVCMTCGHASDGQTTHCDALIQQRRIEKLTMTSVAAEFFCFDCQNEILGKA